MVGIYPLHGTVSGRRADTGLSIFASTRWFSLNPAEMELPADQHAS